MPQEFSLYQKDIFLLLRNGRPPVSSEEFFYEAIVAEACEIASGFGCSIEVNERRLFEAQDYWIWDLQVMSSSGRIAGEGRVMPCAFKHSAFLTYWLRRRIFIEHVRRHVHHDGDEEKQDFFMRYATEVAAFLIGIRLCAYHAAKQRQGNIIAFPDLRKKIDFSITREYAILLRHKNVSPHALYLGYRSLLQGAT